MIWGVSSRCTARRDRSPTGGDECHSPSYHVPVNADIPSVEDPVEEETSWERARREGGRRASASPHRRRGAIAVARHRRPRPEPSRCHRGPRRIRTGKDRGLPPARGKWIPLSPPPARTKHSAARRPRVATSYSSGPTRRPPVIGAGAPVVPGKVIGSPRATRAASTQMPGLPAHRRSIRHRTGRTAPRSAEASARITAGCAPPRRPATDRRAGKCARRGHADRAEGDQRRRAIGRREHAGPGLGQRAVEIQAVEGFRRRQRQPGMRDQPRQHAAIGLPGQRQPAVAVIGLAGRAAGPIVDRAIGRAGVEGDQRAVLADPGDVADAARFSTASGLGSARASAACTTGTSGAPCPPAATSAERKSCATVTPVSRARRAASPTCQVKPGAFEPGRGGRCRMVWPWKPIRSAGWPMARTASMWRSVRRATQSARKGSSGAISDARSSSARRSRRSAGA